MVKDRKHTVVMFSIVVVALNPGEKWMNTLESVLNQNYPHYEIIYKDGGSKDHSLEEVQELGRKEPRLKIYQEKDRGIYEAMNQALDHVTGDFILFLNCGDRFYGNELLRETAAFIQDDKGKEGSRKCLVLYGDTYCDKTKTIDYSPPVINGFACYRNIPCHQSCFYSVQLFDKKKYQTNYRIRADYDHFLWCYYKARARMLYINRIVSSYEGGGYSESKANRTRDYKEHRMITKEYMNQKELLRYRLALWLTLAPLRRILAQSRWFAGIYQRGKELFYCCIHHTKKKL